MIRVLVILAVLSIGCRWALGKWPWEYLRSPSTRETAIGNARRLLGVGAGASEREIREAHRRMAAMTHPDRGGSDPRVQEVNAARDLLLDTLPKQQPEKSDEP